MRKSSGLLPAAAGGNIKHTEVGLGGQGVTTFVKGKPVAMQTPGDLLIRVHELLHAQHSGNTRRHGHHPLVQQVAEDMRLHANHWPWPQGRTPDAIAKDASRVLTREAKDIAKAMTESPDDISREDRGAAFAISARNAVVKHAIDGRSFTIPPWLSPAERALFQSVMRDVRYGRLAQAAREIEAAYFDPPDGQEMPPGAPEEGDGEPGDYDDEDGVSSPTVLIDDKGPFLERCGDPANDWSLSTSGSRLHRPSLCRPVPTARIFLRKRPNEPGGITLIDASGSMQLTAQDLLAIINANPAATVALYSGATTEGTIYVAARDGFRRSQEDIADYVDNRPGGNTIDFEAIDWMLRHDGPRVMVTDREFCGESTSKAAIVKLETLEGAGEVTVIENGRDMLPEGYESDNDCD